MLGALGNGILIVFLLAFGAMVGGMVLSYAAHCFLVVVEQTAAGADQVAWPDEPFVDWMWKGLYILWIAAAWLVPAWLIARAAAPDSLVYFLLVEALFFGLFFPVSLLSSLSATSGFMLIRWTVVDRLFRCGGVLAAFYIFSGLVLASAAVLIGLAFPAWAAMQERLATSGPAWLPGFMDIWSWIFILPMTAVTVAVVILLYGRLLGRLGWYLNRVVKTWEKREDRLPIARQAVTQPPKQEVIETAMVVEESAAAKAPPTAPSDYEEGTYGLSPEAPAPIVASVSAPPQRPPPPRREDDDDDPQRPLPSFLQAELIPFLWSRPGLKALAWLTIGGTILAFVIRIEIMFWPR